MGGTLIKLKEFQESFTKNEKKISHYLLENMDEIKTCLLYTSMCIRDRYNSIEISTKNSFLRKVFIQMFLGLLITGGVSWYVVQSQPLISFVAVSYTHLDVYKRQSMGNL